MDIRVQLYDLLLSVVCTGQLPSADWSQADAKDGVSLRPEDQTVQEGQVPLTNREIR